MAGHGCCFTQPLPLNFSLLLRSEENDAAIVTADKCGQNFIITVTSLDGIRGSEANAAEVVWGRDWVGESSGSDMNFVKYYFQSSIFNFDYREHINKLYIQDILCTTYEALP